MEPVTGTPTTYWHRLADGRVQCDVCPRACKLQDGQRGLCFVRGAADGQIVLTTYGRSSGFCVDPIEKKPLNHFLPGTPVLSFGTAGCNLACKFCQNWDISKSREWDTLADAASPDAIAEAAQRLGCRSVAFTYNDPVIFMEYAIDVADACHARGLKAVAVTAGYITAAARPEFFAHMDAANVDLKGFTEDFYRDVCAAELAPVLDTLRYLKHETGVWFELTTLLIPGLNDSDAELDAMTRWVVAELGPDVPMHFTAFHPDYKMLDRPPTPAATLSRARRIALANGVRYAYTGNVHDEAGGTTHCHNCGQRLIGRDWYTPVSYTHLDVYKRQGQGRDDSRAVGRQAGEQPRQRAAEHCTQGQGQQRYRFGPGQGGLEIDLRIGRLERVDKPGVERAGREGAADAVEDHRQQQSGKREGQQESQVVERGQHEGQQRHPLAAHRVGQAAGGHFEQDDGERVDAQRKADLEQAQAARLGQQHRQGKGQGGGKPDQEGDGVIAGANGTYFLSDKVII